MSSRAYTAKVARRRSGSRSRRTATKDLLAPTDVEDNSRIFLYLLGRYLNRVDRLRRGHYLADLELASVAEAVGLASVDVGMRDAEFRTKHGNIRSIVGVSEQRTVNALSVAEATGIPRETARRKLKLLVKHGFIEEPKPSEYVIKPGSLQTPEYLAGSARVIRDTVWFMNECLASGLVRVHRSARGAVKRTLERG
jgi:hypothetical protein